MGILETLIISMGVAWGSGINLYAAVATLGILGATGNIVLPGELVILSDPLVIGAACVMYVVEFFADKVPGVDTGWDTIHTFIRIPAAAVLAAGAVGDISVAAEIAAALAGGTLAAGSHALKSGTRVLINTSPEPFTNIGASLAEDVAVISGVWAAFHYPEVFGGLLIVFVILLVWLLPKLWHVIRLLYTRIARLFGRQAPPESAGAAGTAAAGTAFRAEADAAVTALAAPEEDEKT
jgi:hypothetical protein